ncbi:MAG: hypothetical protein V1701_11900 [Planctomycetota bacterium]
MGIRLNLIVRLPVKLSARGGCASGAQPTIPGSPSAVNDKGVLQPRIPSSNSLTFKLLEYKSLRSNCRSRTNKGDRSNLFTPRLSRLGFIEGGNPSLAPRTALCILLSACFLLIAPVLAPAEDGKKAEIEASLSLANITKPAEAIVIQGKTNLPQDIILKIALKGIIYSLNGLECSSLYVILVKTDKNGLFNAKIPTGKQSFPAEEYRAEITVDTESIENRKKGLTKLGFKIDELLKTKSVKPIYLAYPYILERREKRAISLSLTLKKLIDFYPEFSNYIANYKKPSDPPLDTKRLKEIQAAISAEKTFIATAQGTQALIRQINTTYENRNIFLDTGEAPALPGIDGVKGIYAKIFIPELCNKVLQDTYYWFDIFRNAVGREFWRDSDKNPASQGMTMAQWEPLGKGLKIHINRITDEYNSYKSEGLFAGELNAKANDILSLLNDLNNIGEAITAHLNAPDDKKLSGRLQELKQSTITKIGKCAPAPAETKPDSPPKK